MLLSAPRAHTKPPYRTDLLRKTLRVLHRPGGHGPSVTRHSEGWPRPRTLPRPATAKRDPLRAFAIVLYRFTVAKRSEKIGTNLFRMARLYERAGRLAGQRGGSQPGQGAPAAEAAGGRRRSILHVEHVHQTRCGRSVACTTAHPRHARFAGAVWGARRKMVFF